MNRRSRRNHTPIFKAKRSGGSARFRTISKAVCTIQLAREHYTFTPVARTLCIVSTAQISQKGSGSPSRRAASG